MEYYSIMNPTEFDIPSNPDDIQQIVSPICTAIYEGLNLGSEEARRYFESRGEEVENYLGSCMTRYVAKDHIKRGASIKSPYQVEELGNNSISICYGRYQLRVLKGKNGEPPTANNTKKNKKFYSQSLPHQLFLPRISWKVNTSLDWETFSKSRNSLNLIVCWEVDASYTISLLQLMCPKKSGKYGQGVRLHWRRVIHHPALSIQPTRTINDEDVDDLEIFFEDASDQDLE